MTEYPKHWKIIVSLISLFLFVVWGVVEYLKNPAEIPMEPVTMSIIALVGLLVALLFKDSPKPQIKNISNKPIKAKGDVVIGDDGINASSDAAEKNISNASITSDASVRIGDTSEGKL